MKPFCFALQNASIGITSEKKLLAIFKPSSFLTTVFIIFSFSSFSGSPAKFYNVTNGTEVILPGSKFSRSPLSHIESIRTTLFLLNDDNTTVLADGVYTEYDNLYHDSVFLEDAFKFTNINENLGIVRYGTVLAVERRPVITKADTVFLKLWKTSRRNYQFEFITTNLDHPGMQAVLHDSYLGTNLPLALNGITTINFAVKTDAASANVNRFKIVYVNYLAATVLPVTFISVNGGEVNKKMGIEWKVENEINVKWYEVERSSNGTDFNTMISISVAGVRNRYNSYSWVDAQPLAGSSFYRIKSVDLDGNKKISVIMKANFGSAVKGGITIYPNPIQGNIINLQFANKITGLYQFRLFNNSGQIAYSGNLFINSPNMSQTIVTNKNLPYGIYQLEIKTPDNTVEIKKAFVQK